MGKRMYFRKAIQLFVVVTLSTSCAGESGSEPGVQPATSLNDVNSELTAESDIQSEEETNWTRSEQMDVQFASGATVRIEVSIGEVRTVSNPDAEINSECALEDLPASGTMFQRIQVSVTSTSTRDIVYPRVLLGFRSSNSGFNSLWKNGNYSIGSAVPRNCVPKQDLEFSMNSTAFSHIGSDKYQMTPMEVEYIRLLLKLEPDAPKDYQWALFVTTSKDEAEVPFVEVKGILPDSVIVGLHDFASTDLPPLKPDAGPANLTEQICRALRSLDVPAREGRGSENLAILSRAYELTDDELAIGVGAIVEYYESNPNDKYRPFSYSLTLGRCDELGL